MIHNNKMPKRIMCVILCALLISTSVLGIVSAAENGSYVSGDYTFTSYEGSNKQDTDTYEWHDECFERSSFKGCGHLRALSAQAAMASRSRWGDAVDKYDQDPSYTSKNMVSFLSGLGFENVTSNDWSHHEMQENSLGVTVGKRTINANGKEYTLIAICQRSAGYRDEWAGNMVLGEGLYHDGFKQARDEALRFVKKYIEENNISGSLKVWIAGHSRGAAVSNMIGGFFAGGGIGYFGNSVSITPEDVYCYTFGTPKTIKNGAANNDLLSVDAARNEAKYQYDTPGGAYNYTKGGTVVPNSEAFGGIRNYPFSCDCITYLPLSNWGYTYYGSVCEYSDVSDDDMQSELAKLDNNVYKTYLEAAPSDFHEKTFDIASLSIKDLDGGLSGKDGFVKFVDDRITKGFSIVSSNEEYVSQGYENVLAALMGTFIMLSPLEEEMDSSLLSNLIQPVAFGYLAYASEALQSEGKADNENEAAAIAILEIVEYAIGETRYIEQYTVDQFISDLGMFIANNKDSDAVKKISETITKVIPSSYDSIARSYFKNFYPNQSVPIENVPMGDITLEYIIACYKGADVNSKAYETAAYREASGVRENLYGIASFMKLFSSDIALISNAINGGEGKFEDFVGAILTIMKKDYDPSTEQPRGNYNTLAEASDGELAKGIDKIIQDAFDVMNSKGIYSDEFRTIISDNGQVMFYHPTQIRKAIVSLLFNSGGEFSTVKNINSAATLIGNGKRLLVPHYTELNVSYGKAGIDWGDEEMLTVAPKAIVGLKCNGLTQELVCPGYASGGTMKYAIGDSSEIAPAGIDFTESIPRALEPGTYNVWYMGEGDLHHYSTSPQCMVVTVGEGEAATTKVTKVPKTGDILGIVL